MVEAGREELEDLDVLVAEQQVGDAIKLLRVKEKQLARAAQGGLRRCSIRVRALAGDVQGEGRPSTRCM